LLRTLVCARPPCRYRCETFVSSTRLRGFHAAALSHTIKRRIVPLTGFGSPSGYHPYCTVDRGAHEPYGQQANHTTPSSTLYCLPEVWSPSVFLSRTELPSSSRIHPAGSVASSGFRTLSTLCSPCDHAGLFHPASTHGVSLRGFVPHAAPYVLSNAGPLVVGAASRLTAILRPHIRGSMHAACSPPVALGFSQFTTLVPPWVCLFEVCCPRRPTEIPQAGSIIPSRSSPRRPSRSPPPLNLRVFQVISDGAVLSREQPPSWRFLPRQLSRRCGSSAERGY